MLAVKGRNCSSTKRVSHSAVHRPYLPGFNVTDVVVNQVSFFVSWKQFRSTLNTHKRGTYTAVLLR